MKNGLKLSNFPIVLSFTVKLTFDVKSKNCIQNVAKLSGKTLDGNVAINPCLFSYSFNI